MYMGPHVILYANSMRLLVRRFEPQNRINIELRVPDAVIYFRLYLWINNDLIVSTL